MSAIDIQSLFCNDGTPASSQRLLDNGKSDAQPHESVLECQNFWNVKLHIHIQGQYVFQLFNTMSWALNEIIGNKSTREVLAVEIVP